MEKDDKNASKPVSGHLNLPNYFKQHMAVCVLSLHQGSTESRKTLEQKFIFQIGTPHGINERFSFNLSIFINLFAAAKTPGTDGLTTEFLKNFWPELKALIVRGFNYAFASGSLSISQRRGIISLIPQKDKNKAILENLRPISLLNVDYKLLTKVLANRLEKVLPKIINSDQTGYVTGRALRWRKY